MQLFQSTRRALSRFRPPVSYQEQAVNSANHICRIRGAKVLVVGANTGEDCKLFADRGAAEIHGLDVIEEVGQNFSHPNVQYHRASIEGCDIAAGSFDLVFSVATMEHVPDINAGFAEMVRLAKPGGTIISHATPLWQSPYGHHMNCFAGHPWVHLVFQRDELVAYARRNGIEGERGIQIEYIVNYMLDPTLFNMKAADQYLSACSSLKGIRVHRNVVNRAPQKLLLHALGILARKMGFSDQNLLGEHHHFVATRFG